MKFGKIALFGSVAAAVLSICAPALADPIYYGELDVSGQGTVITSRTSPGPRLTIQGAIGTTAGGNTRPTGTVTTAGTGDFYETPESLSFFYHFIAPSAQFVFSTASVATPVEFLRINDPDGDITLFYITSVLGAVANSGNAISGTAGQFHGTGYVTFSNLPGTYAVDYQLTTNAGSGSRPFVLSILALAPTPAPEPSSLMLLGTGLTSLVGAVRLRRRRLA